MIRMWRRLSYQEVPALSVRRGHLRRALRTVTLAWAFGVAWLAASSGSHLRILAGQLGFGDLAFGVLAAIPFMATFGQVFAAALIERTGLVKYQFIHFAAVHRGLWLVVAMLPLVLPVPSDVAVVAVLGAVAASWFMAALSAPAWMTWMGMLIPRRLRGRYFAQRERIALMIQVPIVLAIGASVDILFPASDDTRTGLGLSVICGILAAGSLLGVVDILLFRRVPELVAPPHPPSGSEPARAQGLLTPPVPQVRAPNLRAFLIRYLHEPMRDPAFRSYALFGATMTFSMTVAGWFFWLNAMDHLRFGGLGANLLFLVVGPAAGIWSSRWWGRAIDRWGRRPILFVGTVGAVLCVIPWLVLTPDMTGPPILSDIHRWVLSLAEGAFGRQASGDPGQPAAVGAYVIAAMACAFGGAAWTGVNLAQIGIVLGFADGNGRSRYVAASSVLISAGGVIGGVSGGVLAESLRHLQDVPLQRGPLLWNNWHIAFLVAAFARCLALLWLIRMPDPGAAKIRAVTRHMGVNAYNALLTRLFYPVRVFGWSVRKRRPKSGHNPQNS